MILLKLFICDIEIIVQCALHWFFYIIKQIINVIINIHWVVIEQKNIVFA